MLPSGEDIAIFAPTGDFTTPVLPFWQGIDRHPVMMTPRVNQWPWLLPQQIVAKAGHFCKGRIHSQDVKVSVGHQQAFGG